MPIPQPKKYEKQKAYIERCFNSGIMRTEFPEDSQRAAVCHSTWRQAKKKSKQSLLTLNHWGSKRRNAANILSNIPKTTTTLFDPMAGAGNIPILASISNKSIICMEASLTPYLFLKGVIDGTLPAQERIDEALSFTPQQGWLSENNNQHWFTDEDKQNIDGFTIHICQKMQPRNKEWLTLRAALTATLATRYRHKEFRHFNDNRTYDRNALLRTFNICLKRIVNLQQQLTHPRSVFLQNWYELDELPKADVIYLNPPYLSGDELSDYSKDYYTINSVLAQKDYTFESITKDQFIQLLNKSCNQYSITLLSCSPESQQEYSNILQSHYKHYTKKDYEISGLRLSKNFPENFCRQEHLLVASTEPITPPSATSINFSDLSTYNPITLCDNQLREDLKLFLSKNQTAETSLKTKEMLQELYERDTITFDLNKIKPETLQQIITYLKQFVTRQMQLPPILGTLQSKQIITAKTFLSSYDEEYSFPYLLQHNNQIIGYIRIKNIENLPINSIESLQYYSKYPELLGKSLVTITIKDFIPINTYT